MARPKKDKNLRHTRHIMLRLTNTEYEIIAENAKVASLPLADHRDRNRGNRGHDQKIHCNALDADKDAAIQHLGHRCSLQDHVQQPTTNHGKRK